jgi:pimeloyl-ACP methyl ester carboxylesterase
VVAFARACASPSVPFDEGAAREVAAAAVDRSTDVEAMFTNHDLIDGPDPWRDRLGELAAPTLVIHGTDDPLFPLAHGEALAAEIPDAELLVLDGVGHEHPRRAWDRMLPAILERTAG